MTDDTERRARALALVRALRAGEHEEVRALMADAVPPLPPVRDETEDTWGHLLDLQRREEVQAIRASVKDLLVGLAALASEHLEDVFEQGHRRLPRGGAALPTPGRPDTRRGTVTIEPRVGSALPPTRRRGHRRRPFRGRTVLAVQATHRLRAPPGHPASPSADHIRPLMHGGDVLGPLAVAHLVCNVRRGGRRPDTVDFDRPLEWDSPRPGVRPKHSTDWW